MGTRKMNDEKRLSLKTTIALIVIVCLISVGGTMIFFAFYDIVFVKSFPIRFEVSESQHIGINVDPELDFGKVPARSTSFNKFMNLLNDYDFPVYVQIDVKGEGARFVYLEDNGFILEPGEHRKLAITVRVEGGESLGNHTAEALVIYRRV